MNEKGSEPKADAYIGLILVCICYILTVCIGMYMDILESKMSNCWIRRNFMLYTMYKTYEFEVNLVGYNKVWKICFVK
jgi:hypothetical protein